MVQLDTNFLVRVQVAGSVEEARYQRLVRAGEVFSISAVAWGEYLCGPVSAVEMAAARYLVGEIKPLLVGDAELAAQLFNATGRRSRSFADCMLLPSPSRARRRWRRATPLILFHLSRSV